MKTPGFINSIGAGLAKSGVKLKQASPTIFIVAGVVGLVGAGVAACIETTKASNVVKAHKERIDEIKEAQEIAENGELPDGQTWTERDYKANMLKAYAKTGLEWAKLYGIPVVVAGLSIGLIFGSHNIMKYRYTTAVSTITMLEESFRHYRDNVIERYGKDVDQELRFDVKHEQFEEETVDANGKKKKVKKDVAVSEYDGYSPFARFFDSSSREWNEDIAVNKDFLARTQRWANDRLKTKGFLTVAELYEHLDFISDDNDGRILTHGWVYDADKYGEEGGDNYINFYDEAVESYKKSANRRFVNGLENVILLDFNCTYIADKI